MTKRITNLGAIGLAWLCLHTIAFAQITNPLAQPAQTNGQKRLHVWWRDFAPAKYPIIATEFGGFARLPATDGPPPATAPAGSGNRNAAYGPAIIKYLEGKGISWTVWCFDPEWGPTLIRNWNYELNPSGEFAKAAMNGEIK